MNTNPCLTVSLLSQLTNQELQSNYLNHLDRTPEIASLLAQITDKDLALRIVNLALEVDLSLGASLSSSIDPELQQIVVDDIDRMEIPTPFKIELWHKTKSKAALPYLQDIFIFKHRQPNDWDGKQTISSAIAAISCIDRELAVALLIEDLSDSDWYRNAVEHLAKLAPIEAIELLAPFLNDPDLTSVWDGKHFVMSALEQIGTDEAIDKIRSALENKCRWSQTPYIYGLGIVADPAMVEHLIYLLYDHETTDLCLEAIDTLEHIGGEKVFDWLHQAMYWISNKADRLYGPFDKIVEALFKLDRDRTLIALAGAIQSYDPIVRKCAAIALSDWSIPIDDRNITILLNALDDRDPDVQLKIVGWIRYTIDLILSGCYSNNVNITPELIVRAIADTKPILLKYASHPDRTIRDRIITMLLDSESDERESIEIWLGDISHTYKILDRLEPVTIEPSDLPTFLTYLKQDLKAGVVGNLRKISEDSMLSILLELIHDPEFEIRTAAVVQIVELDSDLIFPIVLELASNSELVAILISILEHLAERDPHATIFSNFYRDRNIALNFIETAEKTCVDNIRNKTHHVNDEIFALREIGNDLAITALQEILEAGNNYDDVDQSIPTLARIGTERSMSVLLSFFLPNANIFYGWIAIQFHNLGKLGLIPQLRSAQRQVYSERSSELIETIQKREGLYNPDFSDRSHPLFEPPSPRLRDILLGNTATAIET
jgi:HEAT repeat protein